MGKMHNWVNLGEYLGECLGAYGGEYLDEYLGECLDEYLREIDIWEKYITE